MPELPEVETIVRDLQKPLLGKIFTDVLVRDTLVLRQPPKDFSRRLKGRTIQSVERRGKAIVMALSSGESLVVQVMMTGQLVLNAKDHAHTRVVFHLSGGTSLLYNDQRRFGQLRVISDLQELGYFRILGPEPFAKAFNAAYMSEALQASGRPIKNTLLDHTFVAGIGNIYACEILFRSRISPQRLGRSLKPKEIKSLHQWINKVLQQAIDARGSSIRNYRDSQGKKGRFHELLKVYGRQGKPCPRCGAPIQRMVQAGRSTFYCGRCQK